jgi:predicted NBD/HSP70 family sugar kinase
LEPSQARQANRSEVLWALLQGGAPSRESLARRTGLSAATVSRVIDGLVREGLVREHATVPTGRPGRRVSPVEFVADTGTVVGVDLGGSNFRAMSSDLLGNVSGRVRTATPSRLGAKALAAWVSRQVRSLKAPGPLRSVVVGLPAVVHPTDFTVRGAPNLPQIEGLAFVEALQEDLQLPVSFDNDSNLALVGEVRLGAARGHSSAVMLTIGTGLGAGVFLQGGLLRGQSGFVGEFGYLPVGGQGETLEEVLSARGLVAAAALCGTELPSPEPIFARGVPQVFRKLRRRFEDCLLLCLAVIAAAYDPSVVVIGGGVAASLQDEVLSNVETRLKQLLPSCPVLAASQLGDPAGAIGALVVALRDAYSQLGVDEAALDGRIGPGLGQLPEARGEVAENVP